MKTKQLKQALNQHSLRVHNKKTNIKIFIGGIIIGITAWELGALLTDLLLIILTK